MDRQFSRSSPRQEAEERKEEMSVQTQSLPPYLQGMADSIDRIKLEVETLTAGLSDEQLRWSPDNRRWSIGQILDHLNKVASPLIPKLDEAIDRVRKNGLTGSPPFKYNLLERFFIRILSPNPPFKVPVPPMFIPAVPQDISGAVTKFLEYQDSLKAAIVHSEGVDLKKPRIASPANAKLSLCLGAWLESTVGHEQYHLLQAQAVRNNPNFPNE
jgi:hypothetical protein